MKQILILALMLMFLPFVLLALWITFSEPDMLDAGSSYPVLSNTSAKGEIS